MCLKKAQANTGVHMAPQPVMIFRMPFTRKAASLSLNSTATNSWAEPLEHQVSDHVVLGIAPGDFRAGLRLGRGVIHQPECPGIQPHACGQRGCCRSLRFCFHHYYRWRWGRGWFGVGHPDCWPIIGRRRLGGQNGVGGIGAVRAAARTSHRGGHPAIHRFHIKGVMLPARAFYFDGNHGSKRLKWLADCCHLKAKPGLVARLNLLSGRVRYMNENEYCLGLLRRLRDKSQFPRSIHKRRFIGLQQRLGVFLPRGQGRALAGAVARESLAICKRALRF